MVEFQKKKKKKRKKFMQFVLKVVALECSNVNKTSSKNFRA